MMIRDGVIYSGIMTPNEIRELLGLEPISEPELVVNHSDRMTNCKNCGAPLTETNRCEYCGTRY